MRIIESVIIVLLVILGIQFFLPERVRNRLRQEVMGWIGIIDIILVIVHVLLEGGRWQMVPVYLLSSLFFLYSLNQLNAHYRSSAAVEEPTIQKKGRRMAIALTILMLVAVGSSVSLDFLFPVFSLPEPTGSHSIGTVTFSLTDTSREEVFTTDNPDDYRRILVQAWYPADTMTNQSSVPYVENIDAFGLGIQQSFGFPSFMVSHLTLINTHSYRDVPLSTSQSMYPVILFSHGYGGIVMQNTILMEELASWGYIVFSISHPYESAVTIFPDGSAVYEQSPPAGHSINDSLAIWFHDSTFLLDQLQISNNDNIPDIFWSGLDFDRIGVMGHSFGGTTAEELCLMDSRVITGISFDSPHIGQSLFQNMTKPFMLMFGPDYGNPELNDTVYLHAENTCYGFYVEGTRHYNFADVCIWSPLLQSLGWVGSIDGYYMLELQNNYVRAFFDEQFKGINSPLLDESATDYPEVTFYWNGV